jgi:hypothetical protein
VESQVGPLLLPLPSMILYRSINLLLLLLFIGLPAKDLSNGHQL